MGQDGHREGKCGQGSGSGLLLGPCIASILPSVLRGLSIFPLSPQPLGRRLKYCFPGYTSSLRLFSPRLSALLRPGPQSSALSPSAPTLLMSLAPSPSPKPSPCRRQHRFLCPSLGSKLFFSMQSAKTPLPKFYLLSSLRPCPSIFTLSVPCIYLLSTLGSCLPHQTDYCLSHHSGEFRACRV